jgi:peptide/nickel transport system permease protein
MVGLVILTLMFILAISADWLAPGDPELGLPGYNLQNWGRSYQFPSREHIFGTDNFGRDIFSRIAHGARISLSVGFVAVSIGLFVGVPLGCVAGFYGGLRDNAIMRFLDILLAMPNILLAIAISATLGPGVRNVMIAVGVGSIPIYARTVRALVLTVKEQEFVEAARSCGASDSRLIFRHILPNCIAPVIVESTMGLAGAILSAAGLSFIGVGLMPPTPEWGAMLSDGRPLMYAGFWHMTLFPGLMVAMLIFSLNMMGDGLRDAFDPKLRSGGFSKKRFKRILKQKAQAAETAKLSEGGTA